MNTLLLYMLHVYLITKYHCVRENTAYSKVLYRVITYSYINILKTMFKIHCKIGPPVLMQQTLMTKSWFHVKTVVDYGL